MEYPCICNEVHLTARNGISLIVVFVFVQRFLIKLADILSLENINIPYEKREMALEYINQVKGIL